jgi:NAD(P)-dependent dehydrogenase (short-subunit alcohol dehydrogenase family)
MTMPVCVVLGAGPGLGLAVARRFAREKHAAVLATHSADHAESLASTLRDEGHEAEGTGVDLTDPATIGDVIGGTGERHGRIDVLHITPSAWREKDPLHLTVPELLEDVAFGAGALLPAVQAARPFMRAGARVLVTGSAAADRPWHGAASRGGQPEGRRAEPRHQPRRHAGARRHPRGRGADQRCPRQGGALLTTPDRRRHVAGLHPS